MEWGGPELAQAAVHRRAIADMALPVGKAREAEEGQPPTSPSTAPFWRAQLAAGNGQAKRDSPTCTRVTCRQTRVVGAKNAPSTSTRNRAPRAGVAGPGTGRFGGPANAVAVNFGWLEAWPQSPGLSCRGRGSTEQAGSRWGPRAPCCR